MTLADALMIVGKARLGEKNMSVCGRLKAALR